MKLIPAAITMILSIAAGAVLSGYLGDDSRDAATAEDRGDRSALLRKAVKSRVTERLAEFDKRKEEIDPELEAEALALLDGHMEDALDLKGAMIQTENAVALAEEVILNPDNRAERDVRYVSSRMVRDPLRLAKAFLQSNESAVRARGLEKLGEPLRKGEAAAFELVVAFFDDPDEEVSGAARRLARETARRADGNQDLLAAFEESGLTRLLAAAYVNEESARTKRDLLSALTSLKSPTAEQAWLDTYAREESERRRVEAARELKKFGRTAPYDTLLADYAQKLSSQDQNEVRTALRSVARLGGPEAIALLRAEIEANPEGPNRRTLERSIARMERAQRRNADGAGERGRGRRGR